MARQRQQTAEQPVSSGSWTDDVRAMAPIFFSTRFFLFLLAYSGYAFIGRELPFENPLWYGISPSASAWLRVWERYDSIHYLSILKHGYNYFTPEAMNTAFFPLYPLLGSIVNQVFQMPTFSLLLVSNAAFFFALVFVYRLVKLDYSEAIARRTCWYMAIFPFSFFFAGVYTESLFLLNLAATLYYARRGDWMRAGFWGILLTATRLVGVAGVLAVGVEYMMQRNWDLKRIDRYVLAVLVMPLGLLAYMLYTKYAFGDFFSLFVSSQKGWNRQIEWPWASFQEHITRIRIGTAFPIFIYNLVFSFLALGLSIANFKFQRFSYAVLALALVLIPFSSNSLNAVPRYLIVIVPNFILLASIGEKKTWDLLITAGFLLYLGFLTVLYANWWYVG